MLNRIVPDHDQALRSSGRKKERARKGRGSLSPSHVRILSCAHYFQEQAMIMQEIL